jgi:hypothetical protein
MQPFIFYKRMRRALSAWSKKNLCNRNRAKSYFSICNEISKKIMLSRYQMKKYMNLEH